MSERDRTTATQDDYASALREVERSLRLTRAEVGQLRQALEEIASYPATGDGNQLVKIARVALHRHDAAVVA